MQNPSTVRCQRLRSSAILVSLLCLSVMASAALAQAEEGIKKDQTREVKVLVLNFDPFVSPQRKVRLHEYCGWQDPRALSKDYVSDVERASGGFIRHEIIEWRDIDGFPVKSDGFTYKTREYLRCQRSVRGWHMPDGADYPGRVRSA